jgi:hypothetical protein
MLRMPPYTVGVLATALLELLLSCQWRTVAAVQLGGAVLLVAAAAYTAVCKCQSGCRLFSQIARKARIASYRIIFCNLKIDSSRYPFTVQS